MNEAERKRLDEEADEMIAQMNGSAPKEQDKPTPVPSKSPADEPPPGEQDKETNPGTMIEGLTLENAQERLKNAEASYNHARSKMNDATAKAAELRRENETLTAENMQLKAKVEVLESQAAVAPQQPAEPQGSEQTALDGVTEQFGEDFQPVVDGIKSQEAKVSEVEGQVADMRKTIEHLKQEKEEATQRASEIEHARRVREAHPDVDQIAGSADFEGWKLRQPPAIQSIIKSGSTEDVIWVVSEYKKTLSKPSSPSLEEARQIADPNVSSVVEGPGTGSGTMQFTEQQIAAMSLNEYMKHQEEIDAWMASQVA